MGDDVLLTDSNIAPMQEELFRLYSQGFLTDITLSCEDGKNFEAHRVLLAARSAYFYGIVPKLKVEPVIFLKGVKGSHLEKILKFIYSGSATVSRSQLRPILEVAKSLQVRGLQDLAPAELSRGTNTSVSCSTGHSTKYGSSGSKTSSPVPPRKESDQSFRSSPSQNARDIAVQQQQKLYDKLTSSKKSPSKPGNSHISDKHSPTFKASASSKRGRPPLKTPSAKSVKAEENGEETFKFQYQYISDDSEEIDKDDSNDSDFELAAKRNQSQLLERGSSLKKKRGRPPKNHMSSELIGASHKKYDKDDSEDGDVYDNIGPGTASKSSSDDETDNTSDELDNDQDLDNDSSDSDSDNESEDQSDDDESQHSFPKASSPKVGRKHSEHSKTNSPKKTAESKVKREDGPAGGGGGSTEEFYDSPPPPVRRSGGGRGPMINGKHILPVQCKGKRAELHLSKFGNGTNGKSIKYKGEWVTPEEYEQACGSKTRKYLESITTDYGPLKTLTASGLLKPHPKKCKCSACSDEVLTSSPEKSKKDEKQESIKREGHKQEVPAFKSKNSEVEKTKHQRKREPSVDMDDPDGDRDQSKKRKKEPEKTESRSKPPSSSSSAPTLTSSLPTPNSSHSHTKSTERLTSSSRHSSPKPHFSKHHSSRTEPTSTPSSKQTPTTSSSPSKLSSPSIHKSEIIAPPTLTTTKPMLTSPVTCTASVPSHSSFSPSTTKSLASPSFIALTPATSMNPMPAIQSSLTSSVVPFPSKLSGIPSSGSLTSLPSYSQPSTTVAQATTTLSSPANTTTTNTSSSFGQVKVDSKVALAKQQVPIQMGPPKSSELTSHQSHGHSHAPTMPAQQVQTLGQTLSQVKTGRVAGAVMQVRCKSVPALLYVNKYESGSKGKCILVSPPHAVTEEWMTPNEYEEKSGSKAKKYLSSIKCLGRPLRAYVNSGELRGTGPPPSPKPPKMNKPKPPQLIAPAPSPGQGGLSMGSTLGMAPPGMSPAHIPGSLPQSLTQVAMMGGVSVGQPIILNQSNLANSMHNQMLAPMTLTFAPMSTASMGQQQQAQQQQQHHLQQHQMHPQQQQQQQQQQQMHASGEFIIQHK